MRLARLLSALALVVLFASGGARQTVGANATGETGAATGIAPETVDKSGIAIVGPDAIQFRAKTEDQAMEFDAALSVAMTNRSDMGYPWLDTSTNTVELRTVSTQGSNAAKAAAPDLSSSGSKVVVALGPASIAQLDAIQEAVTHLVEDGAPGANLVWKAEPDQKNGRVIITVIKPEPGLMNYLAGRFGTARIAVRVDDQGGTAFAANRDNDVPAYFGGAAITTSTGKLCTTGFAWTNGTLGSAMLTAAHCISTGGTVSYPGKANAGTVTSGSGENWSDSNGTQYYTGQNVYRGDVALIKYPSGTSSAAWIYSGAPHTSTTLKVHAMASRRSQVGDAACVNGITTGEWCGAVTATNTNFWYAVNGINVWGRHLQGASSGGNTCPTRGDSGAPVYRKQWVDAVAAVGSYSGGVPYVLACDAFFTDIWDAWDGLPGTLKVQ